MKPISSSLSILRFSKRACLILQVLLTVIGVGPVCLAAPDGPTGDAVVVSYMLTEKDLANLKKDYDITDELAQLQGQTFENREKYDAAAGKIVETAPEEYRGIISGQLKDPERTTAYRLTRQSLINLEAGNLPKDILEKIKALEEKTFADGKAFYAVVYEIVPEQSENYLQQITKIAELRTYKLSEAFFEFLQNEKLPPKILEDLQKLRGREFPKKSDLLDEIKRKIENEAAIQPVYDYYQKYYQTEPSNKAGHIIEIIRYKLSEDSLANLKNLKMPESIIEGMRSLKIVGEEYNDKAEFEEKIKPLIEKEELKFKKYRAMIFAAAEKSERYRLGESSARSIVNELAKQQMTDELIQKLREMQGREYPNEYVFKSEALLKMREALQIKDKAEFAQKLNVLLPQLVKLARKERAYSQYAGDPIKLKGDACDCYRDDFTGIVYGFYPFWMGRTETEKDKKQVQKLDFSVLSRIGMYSFSIDQKDRLKYGAEWEKQMARVIKTAHKYRTKVDLVVYHTDWPSWVDNWKRISKNTAEASTAETNTAEAKAAEAFAKIINDTALKIDGITIDMNGYPIEDLAFFIKFIQALNERLEEIREGFALNILLPDKGVHDIEDVLKSFKDIIPEKEHEEGPVDYFIVFLEKPTTDTKKTLRSEIEKDFKGIQRRNMVRKIVPVLSPFGHIRKERKLQPLYDDMIYFEDNYGGVGFWPLPDAETEYEKIVNEEIREVFDINSGDESLFARIIAPACKIICPNRLLFHVIWYIFIAVAFAAVILFYWFCRVRTFMNQFFIFVFIGIVIPLVLLGLSLLFCDPSYRAIAEGNGPLIFIILGIIIFSMLQYRRKKKQTENP